MYTDPDADAEPSAPDAQKYAVFRDPDSSAAAAASTATDYAVFSDPDSTAAPSATGTHCPPPECVNAAGAAAGGGGGGPVSYAVPISSNSAHYSAGVTLNPAYYADKARAQAQGDPVYTDPDADAEPSAPDAQRHTVFRDPDSSAAAAASTATGYAVFSDPDSTAAPSATGAHCPPPECVNAASGAATAAAVNHSYEPPQFGNAAGNTDA